MNPQDYFLENELAPTLDLSGEWAFQLGAEPPRTIIVPSAWEATQADKKTDGPAFYRRAVTVPLEWLTRRVFLEVGAISHHAFMRVNGQTAGEHMGLWTPFQIELTPFLRAGENELEIEVWKLGGHYPARAWLGGFLPDVAVTFGGVWQSLRLRVLEAAAFFDVRVQAQANGEVNVSGQLSGAATHLTAEVLDADGKSVAHAEFTPDGTRFTVTLTVPNPQPFPITTYQLRVTSFFNSQIFSQTTRRIGFPSALPYLRGVLDWGWDAEHIAPNLPSEKILVNFMKARALGFNLWKLCLYVPPEHFFDVADEWGVWLWLELPMWLPQITPAFRAHALREYEAIFRRVHHHPSSAIVSLGCELNALADAEFLQALWGLARQYFPNALLCDNSGSAEAYGGIDLPLSDFYDYHFYSDPHFFEPLIQHFSRAYRPNKPWLYGEFCDADTLRDYARVQDAWWLKDATTEHPDYVPQKEWRERLAAAGITDFGAALTKAARQQATAVRQYILELIRRHNATGGYVVTGWADTPITTSGIVDDLGKSKLFNAIDWQSFNAEVVLTLDRPRRRAWQGGDRPAPRDPYSFWQDESAEFTLIISNGGPKIENVELTWEAFTEKAILALGTTRVEANAGEVCETCHIKLRVPPSARPVEIRLQAHRTDFESQFRIENRWKLWAFPRPTFPKQIALGGSFANMDFAQHFGLTRLARGTEFTAGIPAQAATPYITNSLDDALDAAERQIPNIVLWLTQPDTRLTTNLPFWREAIHTFEPHPLWEAVPHAGFADMRFFSVASELALSAVGVGGENWEIKEIWRRFDARQLTWSTYLAEWHIGNSRIWVTTLRLAGGAGAQPVGFEHNPWGAWLLAQLLRG
ncbi:MAG: hypothetical protein JNL09_04700 [Anaerolineales bacterium]|nr:hypothetical protein [Anaerolineales bacterium]